MTTKRKRNVALEAVAAVAATLPDEPAVNAQPIAAYDRQELVQVAQTWGDTLVELRGLPCGTDEQRAWWASIGQKAHDLHNQFDAARRAQVDPLNASVKDINADFKQTLAALAEAKEIAYSKLSDDATAQGQLQADTLAQAERAAQAGDSAACQAALAQLAGQPVAVPGATTVWTWTYVVEDITKVDRGFLKQEVDDKRIKQVLSALKDRETTDLRIDGIKLQRVARVQPKGGSKP